MRVIHQWKRIEQCKKVSFNERTLEDDEKNFEHDEEPETVGHCEKTHPCDEIVALEMTERNEQEGSEEDGTVVILPVNGSCAA